MIWDYEPLDIIPDGQLGAYRDLLDSRLTGVLNERRLLRRGYPSKACYAVVQSQPVTESGNGFVYAQLTLVDDQGNKVALRVAMRVIPRIAARPDTFQKRAGRRFQEMHKLTSDAGR